MTPMPPTPAEDTFRIYVRGQGGSELGTMRELTLDTDDRTENGNNIRYGFIYSKK